eukprot:1564078-Rhodomonas_salina.2
MALPAPSDSPSSLLPLSLPLSPPPPNRPLSLLLASSLALWLSLAVWARGGQSDGDVGASLRGAHRLPQRHRPRRQTPLLQAPSPSL